MSQTAIGERGYAQPEVLVDTQWVADHSDDPGIRIVESNEDQLVYPSGHVPGAVEIDWTRDLNDQVRREYVGGEGFAELCGRRECGRPVWRPRWGSPACAAARR